MAEGRFEAALAKIGVPAVFRRKGGYERTYGSEGAGFSWSDLHTKIVFFPGRVSGLGEILEDQGLVKIGDAEAYLRGDIEPNDGDRLVHDGEYEISEGVSHWPLFGSTRLYNAVRLERVYESVAGSFAGVDLEWEDDFSMVTDLGSWTVKSAAWSNIGGAVRGVGGGDARLVRGADTLADYIALVDVKVSSGKGGLMVRYSEPATVPQAYSLMLDPTNDEVTLNKLAAGSWTELLSADVKLATGTYYSLRIHAFGKFLICFLEGLYLFTLVDADYLTGYIGLNAIGGTSEFDNVELWNS